MLRNSIDKAAFDALPAPLQAEYKQTGDAFTLQHDEDVGAIKRARDREKQRADDLVTDRDAIKVERDRLDGEVKRVGSPAQIAAKAKEDALLEVKPTLERAARLETSLKTQAMQAAAETVAKAIGGDKNKIALLPTVERRIDVTLGDDDKPKVVIKDAAGKPTALTTDDLVKEIRGDKNYASLVVVEAGSGGVGRPQTQQFQRPQSPGSGASNVPLGKLPDADLVAHMRSKVEGQQAAQ